MRLTIFAVAVAAALPASAATVNLGYQHGFGGSTDPSFPKPIDHSTLWFDFAGRVGPANLGAECEMFQNGRAGLASDKCGARVSRALQFGPVTVFPMAELGYARAPDYDYAYWGAQARVSVSFGRLSLEATVRRRQSMAENYFPNLKGSDLPTTKWRETRFGLAPVLRLSGRVSVGVEGDIDRGSNPDKVLGVFTRLAF